MTDNIQSFPLILSIKDDGSAKRVVDGIALQIDQLVKRRVAGGSDPLGIKAMIAGLSTAPLQKAINDQAAAENSLAQQRERATRDQMAAEAALAQQMARDSQQRIADVQRELDAAMSGIRARQAAQTAAFEQAEAQGNALIALDKQRIAESAALVAAPSQAPQGLYFNPAGTQAAAASARTLANALEEVAAAAHQSATANTEATATDRAFAVTAREAAAAAALEAGRLEELAATQARVAAAAGESGSRFAAAGLLVENSVRAQRFAMIQASQQVQDFAIQIQGGQNPLVAFSEQASQLAFVMSGMGGTAGRVAAFFAGGWGSAIFIGLSALTLFTNGLFENKKAHEEAEKAAKAFGERQAEIKNFIDETTGALKEQNKSLVLNAILTRQAAIAANDKEIADSRRKAFDAASKAAFVTTQAAPGTTTSGVGFTDDSLVQKAIKDAAGNVDVLADSLNRLAADRPQLKKVALEVAGIGGQAILATQNNRKLNEELAALTGNTHVALGKASDLAGLVAVAAATDKYSLAIAKLNLQKKALDASYDNRSFVGTRDDYVAQAGALEKQIKLTEKAKSDAAKAAAAGRADAKRQAGERRAELFAEAAAIGDGTEAIKAADSAYEATILHLKDQLREGLISSSDAKAAAINARQVRNAAVDAAEGMKKLSEALTRDFQQADGENNFVDRYQKILADVAKLRKLIKDSGVDQIKLGDVIYVPADADRLEQQAKSNIYLKPITDANRALSEQAAIDAQILAGHQVEAQFLREKFQILNSYGTLNAEDRAALEAKLAPLRAALDLEHQRGLAIDALNAKNRIQLDYLQNTKTALQDMAVAFAKGDIQGLIATPGKLLDAFQQMQGQKLFESLFGQQFRDLEDQINGGTGLRAAADKFAGSVDKVSTQTDRTTTALDKLAQAAEGAASAVSGGAATTDPSTGDIVVTAARASTIDLSAKTINRLADDQKSALSKAIGKDLLGGLTPILQAASIGQQFGRLLGGSNGASIGGGIGGLLQLGANQIGLGGDLASLTAAAGQYAPLAALAMQAGSAAFNLVAGPGKQKNVTSSGFFGIIGSILGGLFATTKRGGALVTSGTAKPQIFGNDAGTEANAGTLAGSVQSGLNQIANALGVTLGNFAVSIGYFGDKIRVDTSGYTGSLDSKHAPALHGFDTEAEAIQFAIVDALKDGAIKGIHQGAINLLEAGGDLDTALQKALSFEQVFKDLKARTDPVGAALDAVNAKFDSLRQTFAEAGASADDLAKLEQLYGLERADAVKQAQQQLTGALQDLLDTLTYKGDTGLSLRTREANAAAAFDPLAATIRAGGQVDQDKFTAAAQAYLDIERQIFGSSSAYFDKLAEITGLTSQAIANAGGTVATTAAQVTAAAQAATSPTTTTSAISAATTSGIGSYTGIAANDNATLAASIAQALAAQTAALQIAPDRVAQFTAAQLADAIRASVAPLALPAGSNIAPIPTQAMVQAMELQIGTLNDVVVELKQQTVTLQAQLGAVNQNLGTLIENGLAANDRGYVAVKDQNF